MRYAAQDDSVALLENIRLRHRLRDMTKLRDDAWRRLEAMEAARPAADDPRP